MTELRTADNQQAPAAAAGRLTPGEMAGLLLALILAGLTAVTGLCDPDTWWVIADGNRILAGDFAHTNGYSHAFGSHVWNQIEWLSSVVIALFVKVAGLDNLTLLPVLVAIAITLVVADTTRRLSGGRLAPLIFLALLVCLLAALRIRLTARAELFSLLMTPLLLNLWVRRRPRFVWLCGGLGILWGNLHPGVMYGLGLLVLVTTAAWLERDRPAARQAAAGALAFFVGSICNPFGLLNYWHVLDTLFFVQSQELKIDEMRPVVLGEHPTLVSAMVIAGLGLYPALRRRQWLYLLLLAFFPLALKVKRFAPFPLLLLLPFLHRYAQEAIERLTSGQRWRQLGLVASLLALAGGALVAGRELRIWWPVQPFEWRVNKRVLPFGAADFIDRYNPPGNLFNDFNHGGFLAWRFHPHRKMYIDGRVPAYPVEAMNEYTRAAAGPPPMLQALLDKYRMDLALVYRADRVYDHGDFEPKFQPLGWELVYIEGAAYVYLRPGSAAARAVTAPRFNLLGPAATPEGLQQVARTQPEQLIGELVRIDPQRLLIREDFQLFGSAAYSARRPDLAYGFLAAGLERFPADNGLKFGAAMALVTLGRKPEAEALLQAIVARSATPAEATRAQLFLQQMRSVPSGSK